MTGAAGPTILLAALSLVGCSGPAVDPAARRRAERFALGAMEPLSLAPMASWYADARPDGMICGEVEAPPAIHDHQSTLRYVYDETGRTPVGQVEMHAGVASTDAPSAALLAENRTIFDTMWATHCQSSAPLARRIAGWFGRPRGAVGGETPITNAYVEGLLAEGKTR